MKKISLLLALAMMLAVFAAGCGGNDANTDDADTDDVEKKTMVVGVDDAFPPMGFIGDDGELTGFDVELAKAVGERIGYEVVIQPIDWSAKEMELQSGNIDVIWNGYTIGSERNEKVEFTKPYLNNQQLAVVAIDSEYQKLDDLKGKIVGAQVESAGLSALASNKEFSETLADIPEYDTYMYALMDLGTSRLDAAIVDKILIEYVMQQDPGKYRVLPESLGDEYYGIGVRQGEVEFRELIDNTLDEMMEDGSIEAIAAKYFGENIVIRDVPKLTTDELKVLEGKTE